MSDDQGGRKMLGMKAAGVAAVVVLGLGACGSPTGGGGSLEPVEWVGVCVDPSTMVRVSDSACDDHYDWWYYLPGYYPAVGRQAHGGRRVAPAGVRVKMHVSTRGRTVAPVKAPQPRVQVRQQAPQVRAPQPQRRSSWGSGGGSRGGSSGFRSGGRRR